jgi:ABC-type multidrug transport system fused ATPase/permease subunit
MAKKKGNKLISDDLLASLYGEEDSAVKPAPQTVVSQDAAATNTATRDKKKKKNKFLYDDALKSIEIDNVAELPNEPKHSAPPPPHQKAQNASETICANDTGLLAAPLPEITAKARKDKPSSRIRFVESSQPDFVSLGLDKVSVAFGDDVVVKDGTFSVSAGERVGLVGPNGAGKVGVA